MFDDHFPKTKNPLAESRRVMKNNLRQGQVYLKVHCRVIKRTHDGYCSGIDFSPSQEEDDYVDSKIVTETFYCTVPKDVQDTATGRLMSGSYDSEGNVSQDHEWASCLFADWHKPSECDGSGYCNMYDTFVPLEIKYIQCV